LSESRPRARHAGTVDTEDDGDARAAIEEAWIAAARDDPRAFAPLYQRHAPGIYRFCYRKLGDPELANDLTAQVFVKAIEQLHRYRPKPGATFRSWLFTIARNTVTDHWRRFRPTNPLDPALDTLVDGDPGPEQVAVAGDQRAILQAALDTLPDSQRAIVELRLAGLTTREIMATLNMTEPAVKSAQHRAYKRLRDLLPPPEGTPR
jgi:RNA polymerase sigma-70 factor (ECF subfamily)